MNIFLEQIFYFFSLTISIIIPGYFLMWAFFGKKNVFSPLEKFIISSGIGIIANTFILVLIGKLGFPINKISVLISIILFALFCYIIRKNISDRKKYTGHEDQKIAPALSRKQLIIFILILSLSVFIRTVSLKNSINPSTTDLAHHTYWIKSISESGKLPEYKKIDIERTTTGHEIGEPKKIDDFIIGEHLIFSSIMILSGHDAISYEISLTLLFINILSLLTIFILTQRIFMQNDWGNTTALLSFFFIGPIFAISSSQANFVSGGVIGNIMGNLLLPISLYLYLRALQEKNATFLSLAIFSTFGLAYTHHLTTLVFVLVLLATIPLFFVTGIRKSFKDFKALLKIIFSPQVLTMLLLLGIFFFFVMMPDYIQNQAVKTVIGDPNRSTKEGLSITKIATIAGESRFIFGILGLITLIYLRKSLRYPFIILSSWFVVIFIISWEPTLLKINIPSTRVANYIIFPLVILASFFITWVFYKIIRKIPNLYFIKKEWSVTVLILFMIFSLLNGYKNNSNSIKESSSFAQTKMTFEASEYLAEKIDSDEVVLKDHNYIPSDAWMKLFFMKDYNFPFTRSFFFRYEDYPNREHCTNIMISEPNSDEGVNCFKDLGVDFIMINPQIDSKQFEKNNNFEAIYSGENIMIFHKR